MPFEFDPRKSASNQLKHGIDFIKAQALWKSPHVEFSAKAADEKRYLVIGTIKGEFWSAIISYRGMTIRIISVRKSTQQEIAAHAKVAR
jgi:hypothetical protein